MISQIPGKGAKYMTGFTDSTNTPLSGGASYRLKLPPNTPCGQFLVRHSLRSRERSGLANGQPFSRSSSTRATGPRKMPTARPICISVQKIQARSGVGRQSGQGRALSQHHPHPRTMAAPSTTLMSVACPLPVSDPSAFTTPRVTTKRTLTTPIRSITSQRRRTTMGQPPSNSLGVTERSPTVCRL